MNRDRNQEPATAVGPAQPYERPTVTDLGSIADLTLSGSGVTSDGLNANGGS